MRNILYGVLKSEHMIFNETSLSEIAVSELYNSVKKYAFGYQVIDDVKILYYANKCDDLGRWYISCVCDIDVEDFLAPADIFDVSFHTVEEFESQKRAGSYKLEQYPIIYPTKAHIAQMYQGFYEALENNGKLIVRMSFSQGKESFISNSMRLLARFLCVLPMEWSDKISFSVGEENNFSGLNISVVSNYPAEINDNDILVDMTIPSGIVAYNPLVNYWTKCFESDEYSCDKIDTLFEHCVDAESISAVPYLYLYNFANNVNFENYHLLKLKCKYTVDFIKLSEYFDLKCFAEEEKRIAEEQKRLEEVRVLEEKKNIEINKLFVLFQKVFDEKRIYEEQKRLEEIRVLEEKKNIEINKLFVLFQRIFDEKRIAEERKRFEAVNKVGNKHENNFQGCLQYIDDYVGNMKERFDSILKYDEFRNRDYDRREYQNYIDFFACMQKIAQDKSRNYGESTGKKTNIHWSDTEWKVPFNENDEESNEKFDWKYLKYESVPFELPYLKLLYFEYSSNIYSGLLIYLQSIQRVNYIDEAAKKKAEKDGLACDYSYNHSCYGRRVSSIVFYRTNSDIKYTATLDYRIFLDITSLICLYVFVDDITEGYSGFENLNKENIKDLMEKLFIRQDNLKNISFYHCVFLYSSIMGFFENFDNLRINSNLVERAKKFDVIDSIKWLEERFDLKNRNRIYENTLRSFIKKTKNVTFNFYIDKKMARLIQRM